MNNFPKPSRLSQMIFDVVKVLLSYTDVDLHGSVNLGRWDAFEEWLAGPCAKIKLFHEIVDPVHLVVRPNGVASAQVFLLLSSIRIGQPAVALSRTQTPSLSHSKPGLRHSQEKLRWTFAVPL
jgi:hypothetical protein